MVRRNKSIEKLSHITPRDYVIYLIWEKVPAKINFSFYPLIVCLIGGIIIGLFQKKYGEKPPLTDEVMECVKTNKKYRYDNIVVILIMTLLPLVFGASIGPEAGLVGIVVALCYYAKDKLKIKNP